MQDLDPVAPTRHAAASRSCGSRRSPPRAPRPATSDSIGDVARRAQQHEVLRARRAASCRAPCGRAARSVEGPSNDAAGRAARAARARPRARPGRAPPRARRAAARPAGRARRPRRGGSRRSRSRTRARGRRCGRGSATARTPVSRSSAATTSSFVRAQPSTTPRERVEVVSHHAAERRERAHLVPQRLRPRSAPVLIDLGEPGAQLLLRQRRQQAGSVSTAAGWWNAPT